MLQFELQIRVCVEDGGEVSREGGRGVGGRVEVDEGGESDCCVSDPYILSLAKV